MVDFLDQALSRSQYDDYIGIDFGTSNCSVSAWKNGKPELIPVDPGSDDPYKIRSYIYALEASVRVPKPSEDAIGKNLSAVKREINSDLTRLKGELSEHRTPLRRFAREAGKPLELDDLTTRSISRNIEFLEKKLSDQQWLRSTSLRRATSQLVPQESSLTEILANDEIYFGDSAFKRFISSPDEGRYFSSPKNFLGSKVSKAHQDVFQNIVSRLLSYLKSKADSHIGAEVTKVVIARPVQYHGDAGNDQALDIMRNAAAQAGFEDVHFIYEPVAAAYDFESTLKESKTSLIVDIGGGTTDVAICAMNPSKVNEFDREADVCNVKGVRSGGIACDKNLGQLAISEHFGRGGYLKNGLPIPHDNFSGVWAVDDQPKLAAFYKRGRLVSSLLDECDCPDLVKRLKTIIDEKLVHRLMNSVEAAKILLSVNESIELPLKYIDRDLHVPINRGQFEDSLASWLKGVFDLIDSSLIESEIRPCTVFLTGGMSLSPVVQAAVAKRYSDMDICVGSAFSSISNGAARQANKLYKVMGKSIDA